MFILGPFYWDFSCRKGFILKIPYPFGGKLEGFGPKEIIKKGLHLNERCCKVISLIPKATPLKVYINFNIHVQL